MFKNLLLLSGYSAFVVFAIIAFNIYHTRVTSTIPDATKIKTNPIEPTFDMQTLQSLRGRASVPVNLDSKSGVITQDEIDATQGGTLASPTPTITTTPPRTGTQSATPQITQPIQPVQ